MRRMKMIAGSVAVVLALTGVAGTVALSGPAAATAVEAEPVPSEEQAALIAAMKPPKRARPVIAIIGQNDGTEVTDYIIPYSVLTRSGVADTIALATEARAIKLTPALAIEPQATVAEFERRYPDGADYVIVPALHHRADPAAVAFIKTQQAKGAIIVGICSGVKTVSAAGLLANRKATGHWYDVEELRKANPTMRYTPDRRYVVDQGVVTTTGVSASLPVSLALVEAIAGRERAVTLARELGVENWDARHRSANFSLSGKMKQTAAGNMIAFWNKDTFGIAVAPGIDELALAFQADAWSRTYKSKAVSVAAAPGPILTRNGLLLLPDKMAKKKQALPMLEPHTNAMPATALPTALASIKSRYGQRTAVFVALQLEYPWSK